ncbi:MAG: SWIM zinc finger family protein [Myxococcota bacterium]
MSWFPKSRPKPVEGGIRARSKRGDIGEEWWSKRFIDVLESFAISSRIKRGKRYARKGQVVELRVERGGVDARVQGSRATPYRIELGQAALDEDVWERVVELLVEDATITARLLAGQMPPDIEEVFDEAGSSLFPQQYEDISATCSCPDRANPCKHIAAVFYILAESFDDEPFGLLLWRGKSRDDLMAMLREARGTASGRRSRDADEPLAGSLDDFWGVGALDEIQVGQAEATDASLMLRRLGRPPGALRVVRERLQELYGALGEE